MKLYECPKNSIVKLAQDEPVKLPPASINFEDNHFIFKHVDGMYSYCTTMAGEVFHPAAWTEVMIIGRVENNV